MLLRVAVAAYGSQPPPLLAREALEFVKWLPDNVTLLLGGCWGLMGVVARAAAERGLRLVLVLPYTAEEECRGIGGELVLTGASPNIRSCILVRSCDVLVALGGGAGTLMEALMAYREGKPVIALVGYGADTDEYFELAARRGGFDSRKRVPIYIARSGREAAQLIERLATHTHG